MSKKGRWISVAYLLLMSYLIGNKTLNFFNPESPIHSYFIILRAFDISFYIPFLLACLQIAFSLLSLIPLFLYIFQIEFLNKTFWKYFFFFNLLFDICGHNYEMNDIIGIYNANPRIALTVFLSSIIPYFPKYIACFRYAFSIKK